MPPRNHGYVKSKPPNKIVEKIKIELAKKKLHDLGMELIKETEIKEYYDEFQQFMGWNHPIDFKIEAFSSKREGRNSWATVQMPKASGAPYTLEVDITASSIRKNDYKSLLFHEFTHIYDEMTIHEKMRKRGLQKTGSWYTEAHATNVELMCSSGMQSFDSEEQVSLSTVIPYFGREISIEGYGQNKEKEISYQLEQRNWAMAIKHLQYYIGYMLFVKAHCPGEESMQIEKRGNLFIQEKFGIEAMLIKEILFMEHISFENFGRIKNLELKLLKKLIQRS